MPKYTRIGTQSYGMSPSNSFIVVRVLKYTEGTSKAEVDGTTAKFLRVPKAGVVVRLA